MTFPTVHNNKPPIPPRFGVATPPRRLILPSETHAAPQFSASGLKNERFGLLRTVQGLFSYMRHGQNGKAVQAAFLRWGVPALALLTGPFGWVAGLAASPVIFLAHRRGKKMWDALDKTTLEGPIKHFTLAKEMVEATKIDDIKPQSGKNPFGAILKQFNEGVASVFTDANARDENLIQRLHVQEDKFFGRKLKHAFHVHVAYKDRFMGRLLRRMHSVGRTKFTFFLRPLRVVLIPVALLLQGILTLGAHRQVTRMLVK